MKISVIIPAYNEEGYVRKTIQSVLDRGGDHIKEIIVADGGSKDQTVKEAGSASARVYTSPSRGRAAQMNYGASKSQAEVLYFLHADSIPAKGFARKIISEVEKGRPAGCFRLAFDRSNVLLNFYAWCTRFDIDAFRFGDQSLFITTELFSKIGGFRDDHIVMEDHEIIKRIKRRTSFTILEDTVTTSSRKYERNGIVRLQCIFTLIFVLYRMGVPQPKLLLIYKKLVH